MLAHRPFSAARVAPPDGLEHGKMLRLDKPLALDRLRLRKLARQVHARFDLLMNEGQRRNEELVLRRARHGQMKGEIIPGADSFAADDLLEGVPRLLDGIEVSLIGLLGG
jgi:hypothetical protein